MTFKNPLNYCTYLMSISRLQSEFKRLQLMPPRYMFVDFDGIDLSEWEICMIGPASSPYEACLFHVHLSIGREYPISPPTITFNSRILHPNISDRGLVCPNLVNKDWTHTMGIQDLMELLQDILLIPRMEKAYLMDTYAARLYASDVRALTQEMAKMSL